MSLQSRDEYQVVLEIGFVSLLAAASATLNVTSCIIVWKNPSLQTWHNLFTINLIITDLICTAFTMVFTILVLGYGNWVTGDNMCQFSGYINAVLANVIVSTLALFSFSRYQLFVNPRHYLRTWNKKICLTAIGVVWLFGLVISSPPLFGSGRFRFLKKNAVCFLDFTANRTFSSIYVYVFLAIPLIVAVVYFIKLYIALRNQRRLDSATEIQTQLKQTTRAAKSLLVLAMAFLFCWVPAFVIFSLDAMNVDLSRAACFFSTLSIYIFAVILPLIYVTTSSVFKIAWRRFISRTSTVNPADQQIRNGPNMQSLSTLGLDSAPKEMTTNENNKVREISVKRETIGIEYRE